MHVRGSRDSAMPGMPDSMPGMPDSGMSGMSNMSGMAMYFHTGFMEYILFEKAHTTTKAEFAGACLVVIVVAILYEMLKAFREELHRRRSQQESRVLLHGSPEDRAIVNSATSVRRLFSLWHVLQTGLHVLQVFVSYCLMLIVMTYNVYLALCILLGSAIGYFAVGWRRLQVSEVTHSQSEHCH